MLSLKQITQLFKPEKKENDNSNSKSSEAYLEPSLRSKIKLFVKTVNKEF